jgi:ParB family transcriptional regulator, chromosome partitioning protein
VTSGNFHSIDTEAIQINRERRQRRDLGNIDDLADSIRRLGLIHPIVVTRDYELVAGERRLIAVRRLGWPVIPAQFTDELEPARLRAIELEENIKRKDILWQDQVNAVREYHIIRAKEEPTWTQSDTADAIGLSQPQINAMLQVAKEIAEGNTRVADAPKFSTAEGIVRRKLERQDEQAIRSIKESFGYNAEPDIKQQTIIRANFHEWVPAHAAPRFNFLHCDFPYGIAADSFNQGAAPAHGGYADSKEVWEKLMETLAVATKRICVPSCHLMFWFAMRKGDSRLYEPTAKALEAMGWDINPLPLIWMKTDDVGIIPDPERGPRQVYETCLFGSRGDRKITRAVSNAYGCPTVRDKHMSEKPEPMLRHFFRMFVDEHTVMLDPTCGSGSAVRAAEGLGAKFVLGLEINEEFVERAQDALEKARKLRVQSKELTPEAKTALYGVGPQ